MLELLEARRMFAYVPGTSTTKLVDIHLTGGTLFINGSSRSDSIYVNVVGSNIEVTAYNGIMIVYPTSTHPIYSDLKKTIATASVDFMIVDLKGGNDVLHSPIPVGSATVHGGAGNDKIRGRYGSFRDEGYVYGDEGDDTFECGGQFCNADGGAGADTFRSYASDFGPIVDYDTRTASLNVDMNSVGSDGEAGENDNVEPSCFGVRGGSGNDYIAGSFTVVGTITSGEGRFYGGDGNDTIDGGVGYDAVLGEGGDDVLYSGAVGDGPDIGGYVDGGLGSDIVHGTGNPGDMLFGGGGGVDQILPN
jgi:Ca2+-binding RTX toxin-like protein